MGSSPETRNDYEVNKCRHDETVTSLNHCDKNGTFQLHLAFSFFSV